MLKLFRFAPLALVVLSLPGHAQRGAGSAVGLEIPAPAPPTKGHFLAGTYVVSSYAPTAAGYGYGYGYGVQPYLRYQLGSSATGRPRPFVQYTFVPYRPQGFGTGPGYGFDGLPANAGFAPLAQQAVPTGYGGAGSYGGLGAFSVGIPMRIGAGSAVLNIGGALVQDAFMQSVRGR
ncbi:hypothetical protein GCM10027594_35920 [Hymenobacter agri]